MDNFSTLVAPEPCCSVTPGQFIGFMAFDALIFLGIIVGNTLVVMSVMSFPKMRSPTNVFLASLAVADLFVAFACLPCDIIFSLGVAGEVSPWLCLVGSSLTCVSFSVSVNHLAVIAYDRYLAITKPLRYYTQMTLRRVRYLILASWTIAIFYNLLPFFGWNQLSTYNLDYCDLLFIHPFSYRCVGTVVLTVTPFIFMGYFYLRIYLVARKHHRRIAAEAHAVQLHPRPLMLEIRAAKTVALVLGIFMLAFSPATLITVGDALFSLPMKELFILEIFFFHLVFSNSAMNPVTYAWRSREFRWAFVKLLAPIFPCRYWKSLSERATRNLTNNPNDSLTVNPDSAPDEGIDLGSTSSSRNELTNTHTGTTDYVFQLQNGGETSSRVWCIDVR
ncbi:adenosine receptor A1-like [Patiria miniata]|uniref:G-protein coupled receptors family 1 profile domain-containing protein n=1 Tax=Patiria miniata TaxID=46514 RepID=A0A914AT98_PATMI|nr:adenosine receptor A1-like [Patiria miniata]